MKLIQLIADHKIEIVAFAGTVHVGITHVYLFVVKAGGLRKLWSDFLGPKQPQAAAEQIINHENST